MHFIIIDDFSSDRIRLKELIGQDCAAHEVMADFSLFESGEEFLAAYRPGFCDALFLDILMGGMSGVDVARAVRETDGRLPIIFTTTEPDFALAGFAVHAMDYLVKPLELEKVSWCMDRLREYLAQPAFVELWAADGRGCSVRRMVALDDIFHARYLSHSLLIHTAAGEIRSTLSFHEFVSLLPQTDRFYVCGRGVLVNLSQVGQLEEGNIRMKNGEEILFSRRNTPQVRKAYADYQFTRCRKGGWA